MKRRACIAAAALSCLIAGNAAAASPDAFDALDLRVLLQGLVSEEQVSAMFEYLRNAVIAAAEGREGPMPEMLRRELERIDADVRLRGTVAGLLLLKQLEAEVKSLLRAPLPEPARPAPPIYSPSIRT